MPMGTSARCARTDSTMSRSSGKYPLSARLTMIRLESGICPRARAVTLPVGYRASPGRYRVQINPLSAEVSLRAYGAVIPMRYIENVSRAAPGTCPGRDCLQRCQRGEFLPHLVEI